MPTSYNGIGTHYYGRRHPAKRQGVCPSCKRPAWLESYDTRLWFIVLFLPVIPLGRKRVIDQCSVCSRHMAMNLQRYETEREVQTAASLGAYRSSPSIESAVQSHGQLLEFHDLEHATEVRQDALKRFPTDPALREGLATQVALMGLEDEAQQLRREAEALDPQAPAVRCRRAWQQVDDGDLDAARESLAFVEPAGEGAKNLAALNLLNHLAGAFQTAKRHDEALELAGIVLREAPHMGQDRDFRAFVSRSEKVVKPPFSLLPERDRSIRPPVDPTKAWAARNNRRTAVVLALSLVAVVGGLAGYNEWTRGHRTVHVANATGQTMTVAIDGGTPVTLGPGMGQITVAEGHHTATFGGPGGAAQPEPIAFDIGSDYWERFSHKPLWVLNPGGEAVFQSSTLYYAEQPQPAVNEVVAGSRFLARDHVDYAFVDPPEKIQISSKGPQIVEKSALLWIPLPADEAFGLLINHDREAALALAERRLNRPPAPPALLTAYLETIRSKDDMSRVEAFLRTGLDRRPVDIAWHRAYQSLNQAAGGDLATLTAWYDAALARDPNNAPLLYLRARLETDPAPERQWLDRALAADPKLGWPWRSLAGRAMTRADWDECLKDLAEARSRGLTDADLDELEHVARLALGQAPELVDTYRAALTANVHDHNKVPFLFDALAASGQADRIEPELAAWTARLPSEAQAALATSGVFQALAAYQAGRLDDGLTLCEQKSDLRHTPVHAEALAAAGRATEVDAEPAFASSRDGSYRVALSVALALAQEGKPEAAARWREAARLGMSSLHGDQARLAAWLDSNAPPPPIDSIRNVYAEPRDRALVLATLAVLHPDQADTYRDEARKFNLQRIPPYLVLRRFLGDASPTP
jgi:hypothetical protein